MIVVFLSPFPFSPLSPASTLSEDLFLPVPGFGCACVCFLGPRDFPFLPIGASDLTLIFVCLFLFYFYF